MATNAVPLRFATRATHLIAAAASLSEGVVLLPALYCREVADAVVARGARYRVYDVGPDLGVPVGELARVVTADVGAVVVNHPFGLARGCPRSALPGVLFVEDACHALRTSLHPGSTIGRESDVVVWSPRKELGWHEGGAVWGPMASRVALDRGGGPTPAPSLAARWAGVDVDALRDAGRARTTLARAILGELLPPVREGEVLTALPLRSRHRDEVVVRLRARGIPAWYWQEPLEGVSPTATPTAWALRQDLFLVPLGDEPAPWLEVLRGEALIPWEAPRPLRRPPEPTGEMLRVELERVSSTFCPLRWTYLQVDLEHGRVKACCKTPFLDLSSADLVAGPAAIFNNEVFAERRREMLAGTPHPDCDECHRQEASGLLSYRLLQSGRFGEDWAAITNPVRVRSAVARHLEVIFRTTCDLRCTYCGPEFSSSWASHLRRAGPYPPVDGGADRPPAPAPARFQEIFWRWFAESQADIRFVQVNGGEPLLQPEFHAFMARLLATPEAEGIRLGVITNLNAPPAHLERLEEHLPTLIARHGFRFGISQDSVGRRAEFIRQGLRWDRFERNLRHLLSRHPGLDVQIAPTMSVLNVTSIGDLVEFAARLSDEYGATIQFRPSIVMNPSHLHPGILTPRYAAYLEDARADLERLGRWPELAARLGEIARTLGQGPDLQRHRRQFLAWFEEHARRTGVPLLGVFPELEAFVRECGEAAERGET